MRPKIALKHHPEGHFVLQGSSSCPATPVTPCNTRKKHAEEGELLNNLFFSRGASHGTGSIKGDPPLLYLKKPHEVH